MAQSATAGGLCVNPDPRIRPESEFLLLRAQVLIVLTGEMTVLKQLTGPGLFAWAPPVSSSTFRPHSTAKHAEATEGARLQSVSAVGGSRVPPGCHPSPGIRRLKHQLISQVYKCGSQTGLPTPPGEH